MRHKRLVRQLGGVAGGCAFALTSALLLAPSAAQAQMSLPPNVPTGMVGTNSSANVNVGESLAQNSAPAPASGLITVPSPEQAPMPEMPVQTAAGPQGSQTGYLFSLADLGKSIGQTLKNNGIYLNGDFSGAWIDNVSGGARAGNVFDQQSYLGVDLDMNTIAGIKGAAIHFQVDDRSGPNPNGFTGAGVGQSVTYYGQQTWHIGEFSWDQSLFNDHVRILAGRINPTFDFDFDPIYCNFLTLAICANGVDNYFYSGANFFPESYYGARITLKPTAATYFRFGAYQTDPTSLLATHHSLGESWALLPNASQGVEVPFQLGYETNFDNDAFPRSYSVGGFWSNSPYTDPIFSSFAGLGGGATGAAAGAGINLNAYTHDPNQSGVWLQTDQMVYRPDMTSHRGLSLFTNFMFSATGVMPVNNQWTAGAVYTGLFKSRPYDTINLGGTVFQLNQRTEQAGALALPAGQHLAATEEVVEFNYGFMAAPGIEFQPLVQGIVDPDQYGYAPKKAQMPQAVETGLQLSISLNDALGLPAFVRSN
jgi:porin